MDRGCERDDNGRFIGKTIYSFKKGHIGYGLGIPRTEEVKRKIGLAHKGKKLSEETKKKISISGTGRRFFFKRTLINGYKKQFERNDSAYKNFSKSVKSRDGWRCKIEDKECSGKVIAHHILPVRNYPELTYNINNGITLCQFHHPLKREQEKRLIPTFQRLVEAKRT